MHGTAACRGGRSAGRCGVMPPNCHLVIKSLHPFKDGDTAIVAGIVNERSVSSKHVSPHHAGGTRHACGRSCQGDWVGMRIVGTLAVAAIISSVAYAAPANADDHSSIPAGVKGQIKAKCIGRYPDNYLMQSDCVRGEFQAYLEMQLMVGSATTTKEMAGSVYYRNCAAARSAGAAPIRIGEPGYARKLDRDGDGIACE